ncbi:MAG: hypothetical protein V4574_05390 [Pseudomonadota bacterium]
MVVTLVRTILTDTKDEYDSFSLDLFVDPFGIIDDRIVTYGRWGKLESNDVWPLIVRHDLGSGEGRLDFGCEADSPELDAERFAWTNVSSKRIAKGEYVTILYDGDEICYRITQVKELPSGEDFQPKLPT